MNYIRKTDVKERILTTTDEQLIAQGSVAEKLLQSDLFNDTVNSLVNASFQTFTNSKPEESDQRERAYHHYRALVDIVSTLLRRLDRSHVSSIYKDRYWNKCKCHELPLGVDWAVFDWAVNSGPSRAAKALQRAVGSFEDGAIGPKTLEAVKASNRVDIIESMANEREAFYRSLSTFDTFGKGWLRRNQETMEQALQMG
jgi:hypothetical protein